MAKRVAPNEPTGCASPRPGMGKGRKDEVQSTKYEKGWSAECGMEGSLDTPTGRGGKKGAGKMEQGMRIAEWGTDNESRTTKNLSGRTKPFRRKPKAAKMKSPKSKVQIERRPEGMRNGGFWIGERRRAEARHPKPEGRARLTNHGPRITDYGFMIGRGLRG